MQLVGYAMLLYGFPLLREDGSLLFFSYRGLFILVLSWPVLCTGQHSYGFKRSGVGRIV